MKVSQKPSRAMMKLALMRTTTGKEDPELPLLQRIRSLVIMNVSEFLSYQPQKLQPPKNASQSSNNRHIST
jgi:hypothetical protein